MSKPPYPFVDVQISTDAKYFELGLLRVEVTGSQIHSIIGSKTASEQEEITSKAPSQGPQADEQKTNEEDSKKESEYVYQLRTILQTDSEIGWELRLATWQSRECVEVFKNKSGEQAGQMIARYIRWTYEGYDTISRSLASFLRMQSDGLRKIAEAGLSFQKKLQILLDSHGLNWRVEGHERTAAKMACVEITAPGIPRGYRVRIARFATGWNSTPESISKGLFEDWAKRPEGIFILKNGRKEWEEETRRISSCLNEKEVTA